MAARTDPTPEPQPEAPRCPQCQGALVPYPGRNPYKADSHECPACQTRYRLPRAEEA